MIVKQWAIYVKNTLVSNNVSWKDVPGYREILKAILLEMKERDIAYYPEALKETTCALLYNEKLINIFVTIVLKKTHAFDVPAVSGSCDLIASWFTTIHGNKQLVPPQFDYTLLFKAIHMLMELDHGMSTAKCIWMLYKILHIIPVKQRVLLLQQILTHRKFYHYFFHWSYNVRMVFYYFYFFQLYQTLMPRQDLATDLPEATRSVKAVDNSFFGVPQVNASSTVNSRVLFMGAQGSLSSRPQSDQLGIPKHPASLGKQGKIESVSLQNREATLERLRQLVADKTSTGSIMLAKSRLYQGAEQQTEFEAKFAKRHKEVQQLQQVVDKVKTYLKQNKKDLLKRKSADERQIH